MAAAKGRTVVCKRVSILYKTSGTAALRSVRSSTSTVLVLLLCEYLYFLRSRDPGLGFSFQTPTIFFFPRLFLSAHLRYLTSPPPASAQPPLVACEAR